MPSDLDFISKPNPVEPSAVSHGNLSAHQLDRSTNEHLMPFLLNNRLSQQRRDSPLDVIKAPRQPNQPFGLPISDVLNKDESTGTALRSDQALYTLPKLPVKRGTKRHRVPPVLQGLHEPPPTSRILPSISAEETQVLLPSTRPSRSILNEPSQFDLELSSITIPPPVTSEPTPAGDRSPEKRPSQRNKWSEQETEDLLRGVTKFGIGNWKKILLCSEYSFNKRTAVDLKDRFRVCKPDVYGNPRTKKARRALEAVSAETGVTQKLAEGTGSAPASANMVGATRDDSIAEPPETEAEGGLWKVKRRKRRRFTEEEDQALLRGYEEHGASWQSIQRDPIFQTTNRTPTDLRDRFRTKFPDHYAKAGLVPRPVNFPKPLPRSGASGDDKAENVTHKDAAIPAAAQELARPAQSTPQWHTPSVHNLTHRLHVLPLPLIAAEFPPGFGDLDEDEDVDDPIVLDRSIMDWANSNMPSSRPAPYVEGGMLPGIDPSITLMLPKPGQF